MTDIYESLRQRLDKFPQGFPRTESQVELEILRELFSRDEAEIMHHLRPFPEPASTVAERMGRDVGEMKDVLYQMSKKGLILRGTVGGQQFYLMAPWMIGIWEFQVGSLNKENVQLYEKYYEEGILAERLKAKSAGFRVIPIEKEIQDNREIQPFEKVSEVVESASRFGVAECICRKEARMLGKGCDKLLEACMMFDLAAAYYIENGYGREITKEEAKEILVKAEEDGLVHFSSNHKGNKNFICNCCGCCCKGLYPFVKIKYPHAISKSNYVATIAPDTCAGCETCVERCQVGAISMEDGLALLNRDLCIGCGLCVSTCPSGSIAMELKEPRERPVIFENQIELLQTIATEKNKVYPFE